jgi:hypothetical protein
VKSDNLYLKATKELTGKKAALALKNIEVWQNFSKTMFGP